MRPLRGGGVKPHDERIRNYGGEGSVSSGGSCWETRDDGEVKAHNSSSSERKFIVASNYYFSFVIGKENKFYHLKDNVMLTMVVMV